MWLQPNEGRGEGGAGGQSREALQDYILNLWTPLEAFSKSLSEPLWSQTQTGISRSRQAKKDPVCSPGTGTWLPSLGPLEKGIQEIPTGRGAESWPFLYSVAGCAGKGTGVCAGKKSYL